MSRKIESCSQELSWGQHLQSLLPILAIYLILALHGIGRPSLWEDEFYSVRRVASSTPIWKDGHGFVYFALLRLWIKLGTSEPVLRSLSVLLGGAAVCLTYAMGNVLLGRRAAVMGALIFATSPFFIWYSQEARYITVMIVSTLLTMYAFHGVVSRTRFGWWLAYGGASLLAFFSFLSTLLLPVAQGLYLLGTPSRRPLLRKWVVCQVVVFALFSWWLVKGTHFWTAFVEARRSNQQVRRNAKLLPFSGDFNNVRAAVIPYTFFALSAGLSLGPSPSELHADPSLAALAPYAPMLLVLTALYGGLLLCGFLSLRRDSRMLLVLWVTIPIVGAFAIAKNLNIFYDVRYVALVLPAYVLLLAAGVVRFRRLGAQVMLLSAILAVHGVSLANYYSNPRYAREDTRSAAQFLESAAKPGDVILVVGTVSSLPYYYKGSLPLKSFNTVGDDAQPLTERLKEFTANCDRVWLVQIRPWQMDRAGKVKAALDDTLAQVLSQSFPGVELYAYSNSK